MAPINADVAEVEAQLSAIRVRRNGLAAQRALAVALSAAPRSPLPWSSRRPCAAAPLCSRSRPALAGLAALGLRRLRRLAHPAGMVVASRHRTPGRHPRGARRSPDDAPRRRPVDAAARAPPSADRPDRRRPPTLGSRRARAAAPVALAGAGAAVAVRSSPPPPSTPARLPRPIPVTPTPNRLRYPPRPLAGTTVETTSQDEGLFSKGDSGDRAMASTGRAPVRRDAGPAAPAARRGESRGGDGDGAGDRHRRRATPLPVMSADDNGLDRLRQSIRETFGAPPAPGQRRRRRRQERQAKRDSRQNGAGDDSTQSAKDAPRPDGSTSSARAANGERNDPASTEAQQMTPGAGPNSANQGSRGSGRGGAGGRR